jgi:hypothetical protein
MMSKQELNGNETIPSPPAPPGTAPPVAAAEHWRVHRPMVFGATMRIGVHVPAGTLAACPGACAFDHRPSRPRAQGNPPINAPDEDQAIATLLDEAAQLATAANEKLGDALAMPEQTRRDAAFSEDRQLEFYETDAKPELDEETVGRVSNPG